MKLRAHEYCACVGFSESKAVISKHAARQYRGYDVTKFLQKGLFRQAFSLAYFHNNENQMQHVLQELQTQIKDHAIPGRSIPQNTEDLIRLFGCIPPPQNLSGILYI